MSGRRRTWFYLAASVWLSGCAVGPDYRKPDLPVPTAWSAPMPHGGSTAQLVQWWDRFDDPVLTQLLTMAEADSPTLAQAWANIEKARATLTTNRAAGLPSVTASGSAQRERQQQGTGATTGISTALSGTLDASWEIDLFGKVARNTEAAQARIDARSADWHDARVSLAAEVADDYVQYRACRLLAQTYADEARSQQDTARATAVSVKAGLTSLADGALAEASAASVSATATEQQTQCDVLVKTLVALTGTEETALSPLLAQGPADLPQPDRFAVESVPAALLAQRPDLVSMERELAATSAEIGAAEADRYPSLSFSGSLSRASSLGTVMTTWLAGPALSLPVFDAGKRAAAVDSAQAAYDSQLATYKQGVRTAVKEVEQSLVRLDGAGRRTRDAETAAAGYRQYFEAAERHWRAGGISLLDREEARRNALSADITVITVRRDQIEYWIALYKALGGGWQPENVATPSAKSLGESS